MRKILCFSIACYALMFSCAYATIDLTKEEQQWLTDHPTIVYGADNDFPPFDYLDENQTLTGISSAYIHLIEKKLGITFVYRSGKWSEILDDLQSGQVDFVAASISEERKKTMLFTESFVSIPSAVIARRDNHTITNPNSLNGRRVSTVEGWAWNQNIIRNQPRSILVPYPSLLEAFNAVAFGEVDATVQDLATAGYVIEKNKITTLKTASLYPLPLDLHYSVKSNNPILRDILDKSIKALTKAEIEMIQSKWIQLIPQPFYKNTLFIQISVASLVLVLASLMWILTLKSQVNKQTDSLKITNHQLEDTIENLQTLQRQLVNQEKLAALGGLVAGISHEVNSPLGIIRTAVSVLEKNTSFAHTQYKSNTLTSQQLSDYFDQTEEGTAIIGRSVGKAIDLIQDLKSMSSDQMRELQEIFDLNDYMDTIKSNLKYECKKYHVNVTVKCPSPLFVNSYPGIFSQIFTNLILNSLIHGFYNKPDGTIEITITVQGNHLLILYQDNGRGMDQTTLEKIFDAFFTTKKNAGGTGLGLYIVRSLIEKKLGGSIECLSAPDEGVAFTITIPKDITNGTHPVK